MTGVFASLNEELKPCETPPEMTIDLLAHQKQGLAWMKRKESSGTRSAILADDMGLGKVG
jgi:SNF2 family DNA or RNA helicase